MGVGVDDGAIGPCGIVCAFRNVASRENWHRSEKMIGILLVDDSFDLNLPLRIPVRRLQTHADSPRAALEERPHSIHNFCFAASFINANHVALRNDLAQCWT